ncbi:MAG: trypsin-like peptidase domain-containing protein [Candidatus Competibacteraceae bacterium]|nr:trypsin-like peptidase domain-containing protein [Candidatus Competibacteraceae bacterium]
MARFGAGNSLLRWATVAVALLIAAPARSTDLADAVAKIKSSIVAVGTVQPARQPSAQFLATGFVVGQGSHAITNAHGLPDLLDPQTKETLAIFIGRGKQIESRPATKLAIDPIHDLALLKFEGTPLPPVRLGESKALREGQEVAFTGFPLGVVLGLFPVTHTGIISAISPIAIPAAEAGLLDGSTLKRLRQEPYDVFQLDATAYPGNSGSPLYEPRTGRVVGVINKVFVQESKEAALEKPSGITYAIPIRHAQALLKRAGVPGP